MQLKSQILTYWAHPQGWGWRDPGGGGSAGKIFATMLLHLWFSLIWYATWPCPAKVVFWPIAPIPRVGGICGQNINFATMLLHLWFSLIWYATWLCSEKIKFDLLTPSPGSGGGGGGGGGGGCFRTFIGRTQLSQWWGSYHTWNFFASFIHRTWMRWNFYIGRMNIWLLCKRLSFWTKAGKTSANFLHVDVKLKKSHSGFDLVTVVISKQSFFQHCVGHFWKGNHINME